MTDTNTSASQAETEDEILDYVHGQRKRIVESVIPIISPIVNDPKMLGIALQALDGMSRDALGKKRIKVDEKTTASQDAAAGMIAVMLRKMSDLKPFEAEAPTHRAPVTLPDHVPPPRLVEGETATVARQGDYESFTKDSKSTS